MLILHTSLLGLIYIVCVSFVLIMPRFAFAIAQNIKLCYNNGKVSLRKIKKMMWI